MEESQKNSDKGQLLSGDQTNIFFKYIVDAMKEGATIIDSEGKLEYANRKFFDLLGYTASELIGRHWTFWCHRDDLTRAGNRWVIKNEEVRDGVHTYQVRLQKKEGGYVPVMLMVSKGIDQNFGYKSVGIIVDLSDKLKLESDYKEVSLLNQKILETISAGIITLDDNLLIKSINNQVEKFFGRTMKQVMGLTIDEVFPNLKIFTKWSDWVLRSGRPYHVDRYKLPLMVEDRPMYVNVRIHPLEGSGGSPMGVVCVFDDVSQSARLEEQIESSYRKLEVTHAKLTKLLKRQTDFLAEVSHDLRTPLTIITGNIEVTLQDSNASQAEMREVLDIVGGEAKRMSAMVEDLMMLTKMEEGQIKLKYEQFFVNDLVKDMLVKIDYFNKGLKNVVFRRIDEVLVNGDREKLGVLLWNLIDNGLKYTKDNGEITIEIYAADHKSELIISVEDNGVGIPTDKIEYIFDRFYRIDQARSSDKGGSGLGLAICKWIVEAHKGEIDVESKIGVGSKFIVRIPLAG